MQKYTQEDAKIGGKVATPDGSLRPFFFLEDINMHVINRLINAGMKFDDAFDAVFWLIHNKNGTDMERYVLELESGQRKSADNG